jgi:hypothetical protein
VVFKNVSLNFPSGLAKRVFFPRIRSLLTIAQNKTIMVLENHVQCSVSENGVQGRPATGYTEGGC